MRSDGALKNLTRATATVAGSTAATALLPAVSGKALCITQVTIHNSSSTDTYVNLRDDDATVYVVPAPANGGSTIDFGVEAPLKLAAGKKFDFQSGASVTTIYASAVAYSLA